VSGVWRYFEYYAQTRAGAAGCIGPISIQAQLDRYIADIQNNCECGLMQQFDRKNLLTA